MGSYIVYFLARLIIVFFRLIPRYLGILIIRFLAALVFYLDSKHRHIAAVNLKIAFPELSDSEKTRIARASFQNAAMNLLEISKFTSLASNNIASLVKYDAVHGFENYQAAFAKGKGIIFLTGHFSAWELMPTAHAIYGHPLSFITRPLDNVFLERYLLSVRELKGNQVITKKNSARRILKNLNSGGAIGILMDQNTSPQEGVFVNFFGIPAATTTSVALFALRTDATVMPCYLTPLRHGRYTIKILPPVDTIRTGDMSRDLEINTQHYNEALESIIREQPESWLWGHKRWKYQPAGNPPDLYRLSPEELAQFLTRCRY